MSENDVTNVLINEIRTRQSRRDRALLDGDFANAIDHHQQAIKLAEMCHDVVIGVFDSWLDYESAKQAIGQIISEARLDHRRLQEDEVLARQQDYRDALLSHAVTDGESAENHHA